MCCIHFLWRFYIKWHLIQNELHIANIWTNISENKDLGMTQYLITNRLLKIMQWYGCFTSYLSRQVYFFLSICLFCIPLYQLIIDIEVNIHKEQRHVSLLLHLIYFCRISCASIWHEVLLFFCVVVERFYDVKIDQYLFDIMQHSQLFA